MKQIPKKVKDAILELCDEVESMIGGASEFEESFENGGSESFDTINKKRIRIIRKHFDL